MNNGLSLSQYSLAEVITENQLILVEFDYNQKKTVISELPNPVLYEAQNAVTIFWSHGTKHRIDKLNEHGQWGGMFFDTVMWVLSMRVNEARKITKYPLEIKFAKKKKSDWKLMTIEKPE